MTTPPSSLARHLCVGSLAIGVVIAATRFIPIDGLAHGGALRLPGRFHPVLVHFPIVLLLLVPLLEWAGRKRLALHEAAGFALGLAVPCAVLTVLAGLALAHADGHDGALLVAHYRGGVLLTFATTLTWLLRKRSRVGYNCTLAATLLCLLWTAHNGGSLTHGADYLIEPLPRAVKQVLRIPETPAPETYAPDTVFGAAVRPVIEKHCLACHGPEKQKGDYRMDTFTALLAGGKSGQSAIVPNDILHSEFLRRLSLEPDDEKLMPPRKKSRPTPTEIALLRWWIKQGASREQLLAAVNQVPAEVTALLATAGAASSFDGEAPYGPQVGDYSSLRDEMTRLERSLGIKFVPVSQRAGDGLILRPRGVEPRFGDAEFAQLIPVAPFIVEAELGDTKITDASLVVLQSFSHLKRLHLERTKLTGKTLGELQPLTKLIYLNLCATSVTDETLLKLAPLSNLQQLYLFDSKVSKAGLDRLRTQLSHCRFGPLETASEKPVLPEPTSPLN